MFTRIKDMVLNAMKDKFEEHGTLYADFSCLDPKRFHELKLENGLPDGALTNLFSYIGRFQKDCTLEDFYEEFQDFVKKWDTLKNSLTEDFSKLLDDLNLNSDSDDDDNERNKKEARASTSSTSSRCEFCRECPGCCLLIIKNYNLYRNAYPTMYIAYKFLLTISIVQVSCERSFSILKHIKNRLRSMLTDEHLEALMMMAIERDILTSLSYDDILCTLATKSPTICKLIF